MDISWAEKRLNLSDKLFIVNYLLSSTLCMCTVFINLTGILVVPRKAAQCTFCIFHCNFQFVSLYVFCGWNSILPQNSWSPRLSTLLWNPPPCSPPKSRLDWQPRLPSLPSGGWESHRIWAKKGVPASLKTHRRLSLLGLAALLAPQPPRKAAKHPQLPLA